MKHFFILIMSLPAATGFGQVEDARITVTETIVTAHLYAVKNLQKIDKKYRAGNVYVIKGVDDEVIIYGNGSHVLYDSLPSSTPMEIAKEIYTVIYTNFKMKVATTHIYFVSDDVRSNEEDRDLLNTLMQFGFRDSLLTTVGAFSDPIMDDTSQAVHVQYAHGGSSCDSILGQFNGPFGEWQILPAVVNSLTLYHPGMDMVMGSSCTFPENRLPGNGDVGIYEPPVLFFPVHEDQYAYICPEPMNARTRLYLPYEFELEDSAWDVIIRNMDGEAVINTSTPSSIMPMGDMELEPRSHKLEVYVEGEFAGSVKFRVE